MHGDKHEKNNRMGRKTVTKTWIVRFRKKCRNKKMVIVQLYIILGFYCQRFSNQIYSVY